jgi:hypothetical protein
MPLTQLQQEMADWCSQAPAQGPGSTHAVLCALFSGLPPGDADAGDATLYRGFLFYAAGGPRILGRLYGTLCLTRTVQPAKDWARVAFLFRDGESALASASFFDSADDLVPLDPADQDTVPPVPGQVADFEDAAVTDQYNAEFSSYIMKLTNNWYLSYQLDTVTP